MMDGILLNIDDLAWQLIDVLIEMGKNSNCEIELFDKLLLFRPENENNFTKLISELATETNSCLTKLFTKV